MDKMKILGAVAFSAALAVAMPAMAQPHGGHGPGGGGFHGGGFHGAGGGGFHGMHGGGGIRSSALSGGSFRGAATGGNVRNAQASIGTARPGGFVGRGHDHDGDRFARWHHRDHDRGGRGIGFVAGLAAGSALGLGYDGYYGGGYYGDGYYGDGYAYNDYGPGYVVSSENDVAYCEQRYHSYDPASGTYLGYDGLRHPCP